MKVNNFTLPAKCTQVGLGSDSMIVPTLSCSFSSTYVRPLFQFIIHVFGHSFINLFSSCMFVNNLELLKELLSHTLYAHCSLYSIFVTPYGFCAGEQILVKKLY